MSELFYLIARLASELHGGPLNDVALSLNAIGLIALGLISAFAILCTGYLLGWLASEATWERMGRRRKQ